MNPELIYFLKINAGIALFFAFYRIFLYKDTFFSWRRTMFMCFLALSFFYPLLNIQEWVKEQEPMVAFADFYATVVLPETAIVPTEQVINWTEIAFTALTLIYWVGVVALSLRFLVQLANILRIRIQSRKVYIQGKRIFVPKNASEPFSFFSWIFLHPELYTEGELDEILTHEQTHVDQYHSLDVLFTELMCAACWINPFIWLLKQEIRNNLEYMADNRVLQSGHDYQSYQYHLLGLAHQKAAANLSNSFNVLPLKKRIKMMNKKRTKEIGKAKYLMFLPLAALLLVFSNIETVARTTKNLTKDAIQMVEETPPQDKKKENSTETVAFKNKPVKVDDETVFEAVEQMPEFIGGISALMSYLNKNVKYPKADADAGRQGRVAVSFIVEKDGSVTNPQVARGANSTLDAEALRVVSGMPKWKAGMQKGKAVRVKFTVPVVFRLSDDKVSSSKKMTEVKNIEEVSVVGYGVIEPQHKPTKVSNDPTFDVVEQMPKFPGGQSGLMSYLSENIKYPAEAARKNIQGKVVVQYVVDKEGNIVNPEVIKSASRELDAEAIRVINNMPKWEPGKQKGEAVNVKYTMPIVFRLPEATKKTPATAPTVVKDE